jgi:bifunctional DNA-binding transcriptional regulator/antitoxin component of YhaV-PrlF toxin-antitoxin module
MSTVVQDDGKISIPQEVCDALGIRPGTVLEVHSEAGKLVAWKKDATDVFDEWRGRGQLPAGNNTDEYLGLLRDGDRR